MTDMGRQRAAVVVVGVIAAGVFVAACERREAAPPNAGARPQSVAAPQVPPSAAIAEPDASPLDYFRATAPLALECGLVCAFSNAVTKCIEDTEEGARSSAADSARCVREHAAEAARRVAVLRTTRAPADLAALHSRYMAAATDDAQRVAQLATLLEAEAPALDRARRRRSWQSMWSGEFEVGPSAAIQALSTADTSTTIESIAIVEGLNLYVGRRLACPRRFNPSRSDCRTWRDVVDSLRGDSDALTVIAR